MISRFCLISDIIFKQCLTGEINLKRSLTGRYETSTVAGEKIKAFIPAPLPPEPPLEINNRRQRLLEHAALALGRLDSIALLLPDPDRYFKDVCRRYA